MSLQVWLPLDGNLNNQGLSDLTFYIPFSSDTYVNNNGKIGKCYYNATTSSYNRGIRSNKTIELGTNQSMFCWVNFTTLSNLSGGVGGGIISNHSLSTCSGMGLTIKYVSSTTGYLSVATGNGSKTTCNSYCATTLMSAGTWYHVGYTYDGNNIKLYVNGVLETTQPYTGMYTPSNYLNIFCWEEFQLNGSINDVRVYDHCLSQREVKEISQGLILHYPLRNPSIEATHNWYIDSNYLIYNSWTQGNTNWTITLKNTRVLKLTKNGTVSSGSHLLWLRNSILEQNNIIPLNRVIAVSGYIYKNDSPYSFGYLSSNCNITSMEIDSLTGYFSATVTYSNYQYFFNKTLTGTWNSGDTLTFKDLQIEIKDHPTAFSSSIYRGMSNYSGNYIASIVATNNCTISNSTYPFMLGPTSTGSIFSFDLNSYLSWDPSQDMILRFRIINANSNLNLTFLIGDEQISLDPITSNGWYEFIIRPKTTATMNTTTYTNRISISTASVVSSTFQIYNLSLSPNANNNRIEDCSGFYHTTVGRGDIGVSNTVIANNSSSPRNTTSINFNTGYDYIQSDISMTMDQLSCAFWIKPNSNNDEYSIVASNYNNPSNGFWIATNCEDSKVWFYKSGYVDVDGSLTNNTWYHCVLTFDKGTFKWYINGVEQTLSRNSISDTSLTLSNFTIGNSYSGDSWDTKNYSSLSDFRLYSTALSAQDILDLYDNSLKIDEYEQLYTYEVIPRTSSMSSGTVYSKGRLAYNDITEDNNNSQVTFNNLSEIETKTLIEI